MAIERVLTKTQKRTVLAVHADRQRLLAELSECDAALEDLVQVYRAAHDLPEGEYRFQGDGNEIRIVRVEKAVEAVTPKGDEETPVDDVSTVATSAND